jgi:hypothetical protein
VVAVKYNTFHTAVFGIEESRSSRGSFSAAGADEAIEIEFRPSV